MTTKGQEKGRMKDLFNRDSDTQQETWFFRLSRREMRTKMMSTAEREWKGRRNDRWIGSIGSISSLILSFLFFFSNSHHV